jgi:hypothetical protein
VAATNPNPVIKHKRVIVVDPVRWLGAQRAVVRVRS